MDETYKLSKFGYGLFAVTVRYGQCTHPMAFMLISENLDEKHWRSNQLVVLLWAVKALYGPLLRVERLHTDKDAQEMRAVKKVFGQQAISLCWWHWQKSVDKLLSSSGDVRQRIFFLTCDGVDVPQRDAALLAELNAVAREWNSWGVETQKWKPLSEGEKTHSETVG